ncbi:MAG TPA: ABC transporter permease [Stellaceae bacterium]|jgi:NitT/TauT family transport system permease protein|nr:ABC transporter permease [Stellaceae bacterium]
MKRYRLIDRVLVGVALLLLWQLGSWLLGTYWLSTPWLTISRFCTSTWSGEMLRHAGYTIEEAALGAIIGAVPAIILPFALRRMPTVVAVLDPFMMGGYGAPKLALAPLFILWFGIGIESKIAVVASIVFFIEYFSTLSGVRQLDAKLVQMAQLVGASERQVARHVVFPSAVPNIFAGLRISLPIGIAVAVVTELISSNRGLGYLVQIGAMNFDVTQVFAALLGATILVLAVGYAVDGTERVLLRWRPPADSQQQQLGTA